MNPSFERDLNAIVSVKDFGSLAETINAGVIAGILDHDDVEVETDSGRSIIQSRAEFTTKESHNIAIGETIIVDDKAFELKYPMRDGHGLVTWQLERIDAPV